MSGVSSIQFCFGFFLNCFNFAKPQPLSDALRQFGWALDGALACPDNCADIIVCQGYDRDMKLDFVTQKQVAAIPCYTSSARFREVYQVWCPRL